MLNFDLLISLLLIQRRERFLSLIIIMTLFSELLLKLLVIPLGDRLSMNLCYEIGMINLKFNYKSKKMKVIRTVQTVENSQVLVSLPSEFSGKQVEIIVLTKEYSQVKKKSLKGILQTYANSELMTLESTAWENSVEGKYGDH